MITPSPSSEIDAHYQRKGDIVQLLSISVVSEDVHVLTYVHSVLYVQYTINVILESVHGQDSVFMQCAFK